MAVALRDACDARGVGLLLRELGYALVEPPDGIEITDANGVSGCRHVGSGGGVEALLLPLGDDPRAVARATRVRAALGGGPRPVLLLAPLADSLALASGGLDGRPRVLVVSRDAPAATELDALAELVPAEGGALATLSRHARALDRSSLSRRFFRDFRARRDVVSKAWTGIGTRSKGDRDQLSLLFLSRVVFLYFLQGQGHLLGRDDYLIGLIRAAALEPDPGGRSIFRRVLVPLFFGVLNRPIGARSSDAERLGELPYLNGGLFEEHALERAHPALDLPDDVVIGVFDQLFERYRFTSSDRAKAGALAPIGIQPEMLGRMFEGLMASDRRERTGTFYTPAPIVERIVRHALRAWIAGRPGMDWRAAGMLLRERASAYGDDTLLEDVRGLRVIDPACGSGAFVLGALDQLTRVRRLLGDPAESADVRRQLAADALHGVDVEADAALLCALRLWLALTPAERGRASFVRPLPNLDHRIRQGDTLLDPLDLAGRGDMTTEVWKAAALDPGVRRARRCLLARVRRYGVASADVRASARRRIARAEVRLARRWVDGALRRLDASRRDAHAHARSRDLFGDRARSSAVRAELARLRDARAELRRLRRRLVDERALPFFSFALHFGGDVEPGAFDLVVSNPPWVRSHRWPRALSSLIRSRYRVCGESAGRGGLIGQGTSAGRGGQVDLAMLFVERGLDLLRPGGVLAMLLPSKSFRSLSAGAARGLVAERAHICAIEDHALHHRAIFRRADAFAGVLVGRRASERDGANQEAQRGGGNLESIRVLMTHRTSPPLRFRVAASELTLDRNDRHSPWLIVPPDVRRVLRAMQQRGDPLGQDGRLRVRRGAMTGANAELLFARAERKLGDAVVAWRSADAEADAHRSMLLHVRDLCPIVRGAGIRPFRFESDGFVAWCHDDATARPRAPSRRLSRALAASRPRLRARPGWRAGLPDGVLFRLDRSMLRPRVAWRDIAPDLEVALLPACVPALGARRPLIALNTVYFIAMPDEADAYALTALLGSLPCRVFVRSIAERAKDARFRFFAWTLAALPLPAAWADGTVRKRLACLGERAHAGAADGAVDPALRNEIDDTARELFRLSDAHLRTLQRFDDWLAGRVSAATKASVT